VRILFLMYPALVKYRKVSAAKMSSVRSFDHVLDGIFDSFKSLDFPAISDLTRLKQN